MAVIYKQQHKLSNEELAALPFVSCQIEVGDVVPHATFDPLDTNILIQYHMQLLIHLTPIY